MTDTAIWVIPAKAFQSFYNRFFTALIGFSQNGGNFGIDRIFEIFPFSPDNADLQDDFIARGALNFANGTLHNDGDPVDGSFTDSSVGKVGIYVPQDLKASYAIVGGNVVMTNEASSLYLIFYGMPPEFGMTPRVLIRRLTFGSASFDVDVVGDNGKGLLIRLDYAAAMPPGPVSHELALRPEMLLIFAREMMADGGCGGALSSGKWVINKASMSGVCYVQLEDASPLGNTIAGPYDSQDQAEAQKQTYLQDGTCLG